MKISRALSTLQNANITESFEFAAIQVNELTSCVFQLSQFPRASVVASCYKWYKPVSVTWEYTPYFTNYQAGSVTSVSQATCPTFYSYMNRTQDGAAPTSPQQQLNFILSTGAKPRMFNKKIVMKYRPNWCSPGLMSVGVNTQTSTLTSIVQQGLRCNYDWLATPNAIPPGIQKASTQILPSPLFQDVINPTLSEFDPVVGANTQVGVLTNGTLFNGHNIFISQDRTGPDVLVADVRVVVKWAFKDPNPQFYNFVAEPNQGKPDLEGASIVN